MFRLAFRKPGAWHRGVIVASVVLAGLSCSGAAATDEVQQYREKQALAENFITEKLAVWQRRLALQDWNLNIKLVRASELKPKTLGNIHWDHDTKTATIRVLDVLDYKLPQNEMLQDMEFTVVHELIHLQLSSLPRSDASRRAEERAVNQITDALLKLDRRQ